MGSFLQALQTKTDHAKPNTIYTWISNNWPRI